MNLLQSFFEGFKKGLVIRMIRRNDIILIGTVILICLIVLFIVNNNKKEGSRLVITVDKKVYNTLDLNKDTTYTIKLPNEAFNTIEIKDGYADMILASCPDKLCVSQRRIHYNHETIVCLPNKVVLEVVGGEKNDIDAIAN